jgi:hypothetical protein
MLSSNPGVWLGLFFTWAVYSFFLYKENIFFRFAEHTFLGVAGAINFVMAMQTLRGNTLDPILKGEMIYALGLIIGVIILLRYTKEYRFLGNWSMAFYVGTTLGLSVSRLPVTRIIVPLKSFLLVPNTIDNIVLIMGFFSIMAYFLFGKLHSEAAEKGKNYLGRLGRIFLMVTLGAMFGSALLGRFSMVIERIYFTLQTLGIVA